MNHHQVAIVSLVGSCFDVMGAMYLAYDILGGKHGPLRALTRAVTYGMLFGAGYGLVLGPAFGIAAGVAFGATLALELTRAARGLSPYPFGYELLFSAIRGAGFAVGTSYTHGPKFGIAFGILSFVGQGLAYRLGVRPAMDYQAQRSPGFTRAQAMAVIVRTAGYATAGYVSAAFAHHEMHAVMFGEQVGLAVGVASAVFMLVTPYIEWLSENIPDRRLGVLGVVLILIGFSLQSVQYWLSLLDVPIS